MTLNPIRLARIGFYKWQISRGCTRRKQARANGRIFVSSYTRKA